MLATLAIRLVDSSMFFLQQLQASTIIEQRRETVNIVAHFSVQRYS